MVHEKAIYWMAVGILGMGLCNSLPGKLKSTPDASRHSGLVLRHIESDLYALTGYNTQTNPEAACVHVNPIMIQANLDKAFRVRDQQVTAKLSAAHCNRLRALRIRKNIFVAVSGSSVVSVIPGSM